MRYAEALARLNAGSSSAANIAMIAITTRSSISVKAYEKLLLPGNGPGVVVFIRFISPQSLLFSTLCSLLLQLHHKAKKVSRKIENIFPRVFTLLAPVMNTNSRLQVFIFSSFCRNARSRLIPDFLKAPWAVLFFPPHHPQEEATP